MERKLIYRKQMEQLLPFRNVGASGLKMSTLGIGTWLNFSKSEDHRPIIQAAIERGLCHFDTADMYGALPGWSETLLGDTLSGISRSSYVLSTKVHARVGKWPNDAGLSRKHVMESCSKSLSRLKTDYVDIYYCHRYDPDTPLEETMDALATLKNQGKILYVGISMWPAEAIRQFARLAQEARVQIVANQVQYNVLQRPETEVLDVCREQGIGLVAYSPLAQGLLSGKYRGQAQEHSRGMISYRNKWMKKITDDPMKMTALEQYFDVCDSAGLDYISVAIGWLLAQDNVVSALCGFSSKEQFEQTIRGIGDELPTGLIEEVNALPDWAAVNTQPDENEGKGAVYAVDSP